MNILSDKLVRKYFRHCISPLHDCDGWNDTMAGKILEAMQQPITKGERCLMIGQNGQITETLWMSDPLMGIRSNAIRLPDKFQKSEKCKCGGCVGGCGKCHSQCECKPEYENLIADIADEVGELIRVANNRGAITYTTVLGITERLRELADMARKEKQNMEVIWP